MLDKRLRRILKVVLLVPVGLAVVAVFGFIVMTLWNWLAPAIFGAHTVTFWQALGLLVLARILVGGLSGGHGDHKHGRRRMLESWEKMTPEEREKFRQGLRERRGGCAADTGAVAPDAAPTA
jgi:hypothetical protein